MTFLMAKSEERRAKSQELRAKGGERSAKSEASRRLRSALRPLPSALGPLPSARSGISLIEVLISIGILAVGLLGVAALFPVGSFYMLQAEVKDRSAAHAQQKFADLVGMGMLNPSAWVMIYQPNGFAIPFMAEHKNYTTNDAAYVNSTPLEKRQRITHKFGYAFALDPLAIASATEVPLPPATGARLGRFPLSAATDFRAVNATAPSWQPFVFGGSGHQLPVRRLTFSDPRGPLQNPPVVLPLGLRATESLFQSLDDIASDLPEENNIPGQTLWDTADVNNNGQQQALARQSRGDYSWIATICPTTVQARDALFTDPGSHLYDVSVVVFYKRLLGNILGMIENETVVRGHVANTGTGGGEIIFNVESAINGNLNAVKNLKVGQYVMVTGPHSESSAESPKLFLQWYRVLAIEEVTGFDNDNLPEVLVALRGPDWPWIPTANLQDETQVSNDLRIGIFPGAVAVHTKTMRLGGGGGSGSGSPWDPPGAQRPEIPPPPWWHH